MSPGAFKQPCESKDRPTAQCYFAGWAAPSGVGVPWTRCGWPMAHGSDASEIRPGRTFASLAVCPSVRYRQKVRVRTEEP